MWIEPNTNIKILKNVPLDNTYNHTLYFADVASQTSYFAGLKKHDLNAQTYQRVQRGMARVNYKAEDLYDCNYLMFQNTAFGSKWFYAFITSVEYVNNVVSEIKFELDVMQTWYFDYTLKECFVEREHSLTDNIGDNIVSENLDTGEYVYSDYGQLMHMRDMVVMMAIVDTDKPASGNIFDGVYSGSSLFAYNYDDVESINAKIGEYIEKPDSVVALYTCPKILIPDVGEGGKIMGYKSSGIINIISSTALTGEESFEGYTPKNKKLYTYPFNYFHLDNANGSSLALRYEFFDDLTPVIKINGCITPPVKLVARPCSYKGMRSYDELGGYSELYNESITMESYPMCSWNTDSYKSWLAQNSVPILLNTGMAIGASILSSNPAFAVGSIVNTLSQGYKASIQADISKGTVNTGNVNVANHAQQFYKGRVHVTKTYAKIIDNYFSMFGYATNLVKVPNISGRPHWNYVKTNGCVITGSVPADDMNAICKHYDNGITFWKKGSEVGNYSLDNSPTE